jgi:AcrR family transcriptional regulator
LRDHGQRGQPSLSYDTIVQAAIELADEGGPSAISMRKIAARLGVGTMSLYWYVPSKDDLLDLVLDTVRGEIAVPEIPTGNWRDDLTILARNSRQVMLRHPWLVTFVAAGPPLGPNMLRITELSLAFFDRVGVDARFAIYACMTVDTYVMGFVIREQQEEAVFHDREMQDFDLESDLVSEFRGFLQAYPRILKMIESRIDPDSRDSRDERFEFGLACVLDGIADRIAETRSHHP